jgi:hypothetical protein
MHNLLNTRLTADRLDRIVCQVVAYLFLIACSILGVLMLPELNRMTGVLVLASVTLGWVVMGTLTYQEFKRRSTAGKKSDQKSVISNQ